MGIQERFGNFVGILPPGMNCIMWPIDSVVGRVSARVQQLVCDCSTKVTRLLCVFGVPLCSPVWRVV